MALAAAEIIALERVLLRGWPPARLVTLGGWHCGLDGGITRRPNSVWPLAWEDAHGNAGKALDDTIAEVEDLYRAAGLRPCFRINDAPRPAALDTALARRGYQSEGHSRILVAAPTALPARDAAAPRVLLAPRPSEEWLACYWADRQAAETAPLRGLIGRIDAPHVFAAAVVDGTLASVALAVAVAGWMQVSAVRTLPEWRRRGLARAVMAELAAWSYAQGVRRLALQVEAENDPALALYRQAGFRDAYGYHYRAKPNA